MTFVMSPRVRKFALTAHVAFSVGWVGAVVAYLAFDFTVLTSQDGQTLRTAYVAMDTITVNVIVPLALASLLSGVVMSLGTRWGLFRHYWVLISFMLTTVAVAVLMIETRTIGHLATIAADPTTSGEELRALPSTIVHSAGGLVVLITVLALNVFKPAGVTPYGWRKIRERREESQPSKRVDS